VTEDLRRSLVQHQ